MLVGGDRWSELVFGRLDDGKRLMGGLRHLLTVDAATTEAAAVKAGLSHDTIPGCDEY